MSNPVVYPWRKVMRDVPWFAIILVLVTVVVMLWVGWDFIGRIVALDQSKLVTQLTVKELITLMMLHAILIGACVNLFARKNKCQGFTPVQPNVL